MKSFFPLENMDSALPVLSEIAIWGGLSDEQRLKVFKRLEVGIFEQGEYVFRKGEQPSHIYIVKKGRIDVFIPGEDAVVVKEIATPGKCFGIVALVAMQTYRVTAIAVEKSEVMVLSRQALLSLRHEDMHLFALLMMNIAREIARKLESTDDILLRYAQRYKPV